MDGWPGGASPQILPQIQTAIDMNCIANRARVLVLFAAALLLDISVPVSALVLHPEGEPNLSIWTDRPSDNIIGQWDNSAGCVAISSNCVITTQHQSGNLNTLVEIGGVTYTIDEMWNHPTADLRIAKLYGANLPYFVGINEQTNERGRKTVIAGHGVGRGNLLQTQGKTYGYKWGDSASRTFRMGTNRIESALADSTIGELTSDVIIADFDDLNEGLSTDYETIPADHDSGGGWFIKSGDTWILAGLTRSIELHYEEGHEGDPNHYIFSEAWFRERSDPNEPHADRFEAVRISSYVQWINDTVPPVVPGDLNGDDYVDFADFSVFVHFWRRNDCQWPNPCLGADFEPDGDVDRLDLAEFAYYWLSGERPF